MALVLQNHTCQGHWREQPTALTLRPGWSLAGSHACIECQHFSSELRQALAAPSPFTGKQASLCTKPPCDHAARTMACMLFRVSHELLYFSIVQAARRRLYHVRLQGHGAGNQPQTHTSGRISLSLSLS